MSLSDDWKARTKMLVGTDGAEKLKQAHVLVVGLGGVGASAAEMICRAGIGKMTIVDGDVVQPSNRNRQIPALLSTDGKRKAEVMAERLLDINPELELRVISDFITENKMPELLSESYDYVIDAIDTLAPKIYLIVSSLERKLKIISSMGAGGKFDPMLVKISDISESYQCKLAYYLRKKLHRYGIYKGFYVVFSPEVVPRERVVVVQGERNKKSAVGTISYMPPLFGCTMASAVIRFLLFGEETKNAY